MIESKKLNMWLVLLIILLSAFNVSQVIAQEDFVVIIGKNKVFTEYNYHDAWFEDDPNNPEPWPEQREAYSEGNAAYASLLANPGHAGVAQAIVGVEFQWDLGQYAWEEVKDWPVNVTIDFSYQIEAYWVEGNGSANAGVNIPDFTGPWYNFIGYETGQAGSLGDTVSETFQTTVEGIENLERILKLQTYCQAHSATTGTTTHNSYSEVQISSIKIDFALNEGDIIYRTSANGEMDGCTQPIPSFIPPRKLLNNFTPGHVGVYIGEEEIVEAIFPRIITSTLETFKNQGIYLGARTSDNISSDQRDSIVEFVRNQLGKPYGIWSWFISCLVPLIPDGYLQQKGPVTFTCVGLAEKAYEIVGLNPVINRQENTTISTILPFCGYFVQTDILFPYTQFSSPSLIEIEPPLISCDYGEEFSPYEDKFSLYEIEGEDPLAVLKNKNNPTEKRLIAATILAYRKDSKVVKPLIRILKDESEVTDIRIVVLEALTHYNTSEVVNSISFVLNSKADQNLRLLVARKLGEFKAIEGKDALISASTDESRHVRYEAVKALGEIKDYRVVEPLIYSLNNDKDKYVRGAAALSLANFLDKKNVYESLRNAKQKEKTNYVKKKIISILNNFSK